MTISPGDSIEFDVQVRPFRVPGRFGFKIDLYRPATEDIFERYGSRAAYVKVEVVEGEVTQRE
jgi:hypothetical protein